MLPRVPLPVRITDQRISDQRISLPVSEITGMTYHVERVHSTVTWWQWCLRSRHPGPAVVTRQSCVSARIATERVRLGRRRSRQSEQEAASA